MLGVVLGVGVEKTCVIAAKAARQMRGLDTTVAMEHCLQQSDPEERERKRRCDAEDGKHQYPAILFRAKTPEGWQYQQCQFRFCCGTKDACT